MNSHQDIEESCELCYSLFAKGTPRILWQTLKMLFLNFKNIYKLTLFYFVKEYVTLLSRSLEKYLQITKVENCVTFCGSFKFGIIFFFLLSIYCKWRYIASNLHCTSRCIRFLCFVKHSLF
jgi:hypothetical protein